MVGAFAGALATALVVSGCGSSAVDPSAAARITALEAEVSRLRTQMDDLRLQQLPVGEMTDAELTRHLERASAKTPAAEEATLEQSLRAERKMAQLGEAGLGPYWEDRFAHESVDAAWAPGATSACQPKARAALPVGASLMSFQCRASLCRIEVDGPDTLDPAGVVMNACLAGEPSTLLAGAMANSRVPSGAGRVRAVVFLVRAGRSMVPE